MLCSSLEGCSVGDVVAKQLASSQQVDGQPF